jgi:hypothetical protein
MGVSLTLLLFLRYALHPEKSNFKRFDHLEATVPAASNGRRLFVQFTKRGTAL